MEHPYRPQLPVVAPQKRVVVARERPSHGIVARAFSDGTTELTLGSPKPIWLRVGYGAAVVTLVLGAGAGSRLPDAWCELGIVVPIAAAWMLWQGVRSMKREQIVVTPAALVVRRDGRIAATLALGDVGSVVVGEADVSIVCGREAMPIAHELGYDDAALRWIAQRLRRAIEAAR